MLNKFGSGLQIKQADMENPASVKAMLKDICAEKCGHVSVKQEITTKMPHYGQILKQIVDLILVWTFY